MCPRNGRRVTSGRRSFCGGFCWCEVGEDASRVKDATTADRQLWHWPPQGEGREIQRKGERENSVLYGNCTLPCPREEREASAPEPGGQSLVRGGIQRSTDD